MEIYVLMENTPYRPCFAAEHGLSLFIKTAKRCILFDAGKSAAFADNAALLGVSLEAADAMILSHGHYDHGGGIQRFLELNGHAPVYISKYAFGAYYHGPDRYIGIDPALEGSNRLVKVENSMVIDEALTLCSCNHKAYHYPVDCAGLQERKDGALQPDRFWHEQYLTIQDGGKRIVISGCSHKGILNIVEWLKPDVLIGGFHFMGQEILGEENTVLDQAADILMESDTTYYTCHCTGIKQYAYLKQKMGDRLFYLASGQHIRI